ncbi:hypothetical protein SLS58_003891 [Diplodia intermedia]|uniref:Heterokaryon incompatibility protein n=1 Tax=Diplodia intermedia TaxID=856260 RepID=A0ABR3TUV0_9PEZI
MAAEAARTMSCPACLDLDYDRYDVPLREPYLYEGQGLRYHITSFWELEQRAAQGCKFCDVLHRGISAVWDVAAVGLTGHAASEREQQLRRSTWPTPGTHHQQQHGRRDSKMDEMASYRPRQPADMRRAEEDEHTKFYRPCIELRPGRSVLVSHALYKRVVPTEGGNGYKLGPNPLEFEHFMRRAPLEFYTLSGKQRIVTHGNFLLRSPQDPASPLLQRGWVFQERLLSRRSLHCTASELVWECRERTWCECGDLGGSGSGINGAGTGADDGIGAVAQRRSTKIQFQNMFEPGATPRSLLYDWMSIVTRYNHLQFTNPSDLPFAFAGVVQKVRDRMQDSGGRYFAGLWTADLPRNLLWVGKKKRLDHEKGSRLYPVDWESVGSGPPSWSWIWYAGWPGARSAHYYGYLERVEVDEEAVVDLDRIVCETEDGNPFGSVVKSVLRMSGRVVQGRLRAGEPKVVPKGFTYSHVREDAYVTFDKFDGDLGFPFGTDCYLFVRDSAGEEIEQEVTCLLVGHERERGGAYSKKELRFFVLVLARAGKGQSYRRIGIARWPKSSHVFSGEAVAEVEIV